MKPPRLTPLLGRIAGLAWPLAAARAALAVVGVTDALLVGHLGQAALAAVTDGALVVYALAYLPSGVVGIVSAFASQLTGAGDRAAARRFGFYGLAAALLAGIAALALWPAIPWALARLGHAPELRTLLAGYLRFRLVGMGPTVGLEALGAYYAGTGHTRAPMVASLAALALDVAGNWLLIDGHLGLPAMGVAGSAIGSSLAATCAFLGLLGVFLAEGRGQRGIAAALSGRELGRMIRVGLPVSAGGALDTLAFTVFVNVVVAGFGTTTLAAFMSALQISTIATLPAFACASAGAVLVGQAIGAGASDDVPRVVGATLLGAVAWQALVALFYTLAREPLVGVFAPGGPEARAFIETGAALLLWSAAWTLGEVLFAIHAEALAAAGDTAAPLWIRAAVIGGVLAPGTFVLVAARRAACGEVVAWFVASTVLSAAILAARFLGGAWRRVRLTEFVTTPLGRAAQA